MKYLFLILNLLLGNQYLFAQKKVIDSSAYKTWPILDALPLISNDGNFVSYSISSGINEDRKIIHIVQSTQSHWKLEIAQEVLPYATSFTTDSKYCIFKTKGDSLLIVNLNLRSMEVIPNVSEYQIPKKGNGDWIIYSVIDKENQVTIVRNLKTAKMKILSGISTVYFGNNGSDLVRQTFFKDSHQQLEWMDLTNNKTIIIWSGKEAHDLVVDFNHYQLAFNAAGQIWYYKINSKSPMCLNCEKGYRNSSVDIKKFNKQGDLLFIYLYRTEEHNPKVEKNAPEVWSYMDAKLQSVQETENREKKKGVLSLIRLKDKKIYPVQRYESEMFMNSLNDDIILATHQKNEGDPMESWWNATSVMQFDLIDTKSVKRVSIDFLSKSEIIRPELSPDGKYIVFFDTRNQAYFSYSVVSGKIIGLTEHIAALRNIGSTGQRGIAGWLSDNRSFLVYDDHDIWKLDPTGKISPINITNAYGIKHNIVFSIVSKGDITRISPDIPLLLSALQETTKENGFYSTNLSRLGDPKKLSMGPYVYELKSSNVLFPLDFTPLKAGNNDTYILKRQSVAEYPNFYVTRDFIHFEKLTDLSPQKEYNWYNTELLRWKSLNGKDLSGILYKPENFDPNKKYPIIFYYYQKHSDGLNYYLYPKYSSGGIDIPTYVSNGYLVFLPDINYNLGDPMQGTYESVISAAKYLSKLPFVNSHKMGLQGFSFGAIQTNYLITRSNLFAAACSGSGLGDWISAYASLYGNIYNGYYWSLFGNFENEGQLRMGKSLWENLTSYINSSPILQAQRIKTPLLMMHTKNDKMLHYSNALEFFLALRRLGKKAWMVVYNEGSHAIKGREAKDFTIRMKQFFDHYLMDRPAPNWMLNGVPANQRGFGAGTQIDTASKTPGLGLLTEEQKKTVDLLIDRKPITIIFK